MAYIPYPTYADYDGILGYLDFFAFRWNGGSQLGTGTVLTYAFPSGGTLPSGRGDYGVDGWRAFNDVQRESFRGILAEVEDFSGLKFVEVEDGGMINAVIGLHSERVLGYADYPMVYPEMTTTSDLVMVARNFATNGTLAKLVLYHELGHALGLSHPHEGRKRVMHRDDLDDNTVMTYDQDGTPATRYGSFDVAALQHIYGGPFERRHWTAERLDDGHIAIAGGRGDDRIMGALAENVMAGRFGDDILAGRSEADLIRGNRGADFLRGGGGSDRLNGNAGDDRLMGGSGQDRMTGGAGADTFIFARFATDDRDVIRDFVSGVDRIDLSRTRFDPDDLDFENTGRNSARITGDGIEIVLRRMDADDLSRDDFVFAGDLLS